MTGDGLCTASRSAYTSFCLAALEEAFARHGRPQIFNTDQGSQFTRAAFTEALGSQGVAILGRSTPDELYFASLPAIEQAA